jgi:High potential iron-sulfur protein
MSDDGGSEPVGNARAISVNVSRRGLFQHVAVAGAGAAMLLGAASPAMARMSQKDAGYQEMPKGDQSCSNCSLFSAPASCTLVDGTINQRGWCRYHQNKS